MELATPEMLKEASTPTGSNAQNESGHGDDFVLLDMKSLGLNIDNSTISDPEKTADIATEGREVHVNSAKKASSSKQTSDPDETDVGDVYSELRDELVVNCPDIESTEEALRYESLRWGDKKKVLRDYWIRKRLVQKFETVIGEFPGDKDTHADIRGVRAADHELLRVVQEIFKMYRKLVNMQPYEFPDALRSFHQARQIHHALSMRSDRPRHHIGDTDRFYIWLEEGNDGPRIIGWWKKDENIWKFLEEM